MLFIARMTYPVLIILSVSAIFVLTEQWSCRNPIKCPCGNTGKNVTICSEKSNEDYSCSKWANCKKCEDGLEVCLECPEGFEGSFCTKPTKYIVNFRSKRQASSPPTTDKRRRTQGTRTVIHEVTCPDLKIPKLGSIRCISGDEQRTCTGKCLPGYSFENRETEEEIELNCQDGVWLPTSSFPKCKSGGQCELEMAGHGSYNCTVAMGGTECDVHCNNKYVGNFHCLPGKAWNPPLPNCVRPKGQPRDENRQMCKCKNGGSCDRNGNCICSPGFEGKFCESSTQEILCPDPGQVSNADRRNMDGSPSVGVQQFKVGQSVAYNCHSGFMLQLSSLRTCLESGRWSHDPPFCKPIPSQAVPVTPTTDDADDDIYCLNPGGFKNGRIVYYTSIMSLKGSEAPLDKEEYPEGARLEYHCDKGHSLRGSVSLVCEASGQWSNEPPTCNARSRRTFVQYMYCDDPGPILDGKVKVFSHVDASPIAENDVEYPEGTRLQYTCEDGFALAGLAELVCLSSGFWSANQPFCSNASVEDTMYCDDPGPIFNGKVRAFSHVDASPIAETDGEYPEGTRLQYTCEDGFTLAGLTELVCLSSGFWSSGQPSCSAD